MHIKNHSEKNTMLSIEWFGISIQQNFFMLH